MDDKSKKKAKKRRTRRNLDDLRKRSRSIEENNRNPRENILHYKNALITSKRLTLALFKKSIRSKTVTRAPLCSIDNTKNVAISGNKATSNILTSSHRSLNLCTGGSTICQNNNSFKNTDIQKSSIKNASEINLNENKECSSFTSCSPLHNEFMNFEDSTSEEFKLKCEYLSNSSSYSNSEIESSHCYYEKFMKDLPTYLKEHFPALTNNFLNKNVPYLKQSYLENSYHEREDNTLKCNSLTTNTFEDGAELAIQNPMDYIHAGVSCLQSMKNTQRIRFSNSSSPSISEYGSNTSDIFMNSPEYKYFPHKLNQ